VAKAVKAFLQAISPGQIELVRNGYITLSADFQARVSSAVDAISSVDAPKPE
jgi:phosphate transport system substrate-binding protein